VCDDRGFLIDFEQLLLCDLTFGDFHKQELPQDRVLDYSTTWILYFTASVSHLQTNITSSITPINGRYV